MQSKGTSIKSKCEHACMLISCLQLMLDSLLLTLRRSIDHSRLDNAGMLSWLIIEENMTDFSGDKIFPES